MDKTAIKWLKFIAERYNPKTPEISLAILRCKRERGVSMDKTLSPFWSCLRECFLRASDTNKAKLKGAFPRLVRE